VSLILPIIAHNGLCLGARPDSLNKSLFRS
jgi:hypothetical protein